MPERNREEIQREATVGGKKCRRKLDCNGSPVKEESSGQCVCEVQSGEREEKKQMPDAGRQEGCKKEGTSEQNQWPSNGSIGLTAGKAAFSRE